MGTATEILKIPFEDANGTQTTLAEIGDQTFLIVNVASKCGLTPQYEQLEELQRQYGDQGFTVIGFPCNQFMGQEPGDMETILDYCSTTWGVSFPIMGKIKVNGPSAAALYKALKKAPNAEGKRGPIKWNFEKFILTNSGQLHRFGPTVKPDDPAIVEVITANLTPPQA